MNITIFRNGHCIKRISCFRAVVFLFWSFGSVLILVLLYLYLHTHTYTHNHTSFLISSKWLSELVGGTWAPVLVKNVYVSKVEFNCHIYMGYLFMSFFFFCPCCNLGPALFLALRFYKEYTCWHIIKAFPLCAKSPIKSGFLHEF